MVDALGGVTFFNGTIVNSTTTTTDDAAGAEVENPVTFGDDVRIDGKIWRTEEGGDNPLKIADTIRPAVNNTYDLGTSSFQFKDGYFVGTLNTGTLSASNIYTKGEVYSQTEVDALVTGGGHSHVGETWSGSVQGSATSAVLTIANTGNGFGLAVATSGNYSAIAGVTSGSSAAINGTNTGSGRGVSGVSASNDGVYAMSVSGNSLYVDGRLGVNASSNKAAGFSTIAGGTASISVSNTLVTSNSKILLTVTNIPGGADGTNQNGGIRLCGITSGASFSVCTMDGVAAQEPVDTNADIPFDYLIIN